MLGYFLKSGDETVSKMFTPYIWQEHGLGTLFNNMFSNKVYGPDLKLLLIMYYVEGKFEINGPALTKVNNYSRKNKDINVATTVKLGQFHDRNEFERREFILENTLNAVKLVREKLTKKKLNINFEELMSDIIKAGNAYLIYEGVLS